MPRNPRTIDDPRETIPTEPSQAGTGLPDPLAPKLDKQGINKAFNTKIPKDRDKYIEGYKLSKKEIYTFLKYKGNVTWLDSWKKYVQVVKTAKDAETFKRYVESLKAKVTQIREFIEFKEEKALEADNAETMTTAADFYGG